MAVEIMVVAAMVDTSDNEPMIRVQRGQTVLVRDPSIEGVADQVDVCKATAETLGAEALGELQRQLEEHGESTIKTIRRLQGGGDAG